MIRTDKIIDRLILHEGFKLKPYRCTAGKLTIGVGRNLEDNPLTTAESKACGDYQNGITKNAAIMLLKNDIERFESQLSKNISFYPYLDDERQYALLDMCFNLGLKGLLKFRKMLGCMEIKDYSGAARECLNSKYAYDVGKRAKRIAKLIKTGVWEI